MEIERKWLLKCFPQQLKISEEANVHQGYISTDGVEVRVRSYESHDNTDYILTFKDDIYKNSKGIEAETINCACRKEVETEINKSTFDDLVDIIGKPMISKMTKKYRMDSGHVLEVSLVDFGSLTQFYYAEIEFETVEEANAYVLELPEVLEEVTFNKNYQMKHYWKRTRG